MGGAKLKYQVGPDRSIKHIRINFELILSCFFNITFMKQEPDEYICT
jgi:hypothetical protein